LNKESLAILSNQVVALLTEDLPKLSNNWWQVNVLAKLSFQQQSYVKTSRVTSLTQLDLAAHLRILDQNWHEIANLRDLPMAARNWTKEAQTIRNRWAHAPTTGVPDEDIYRDLDTIERLAQALGASETDIKMLRKMKTDVMSTLKGTTQPSQTKSAPIPEGIFKPGDMVRLKAKPAVTGAITGCLPGSPEDRYLVFHEGSITTYYASQLESATLSQKRISLKPANLHAALSALQLRHPSTSSLYSLFASRINFVPYQFRPVLKLIQSDRPRLLIADEVGVGKTIEAGLILKELQARRELRSVLVICPKPLVAERKWMEELKRFDEQFVHLDGPTLRYCMDEMHLDGVWPQQYSRAILPYSLLDEALLIGKQQGRKRQRGLLELDPPPAFDLVIIDEAHHLKNTETWAHRAARFFCDNAEAAVLLTATPIQLGDNDLYTLLHLLRPDVLPSRKEFDQMAEPNPHLNAAIEAARGARDGWKDKVRNAISKATATTWGQTVLMVDDRLQESLDLLDPETETKENRLTLIRKLEGLYTFSPLINRTRRRDIGNFTTRKPETVAVDYTPEQAALHHDLVDLVSRMLAHRHGDQNLKFMLTTLRRQVASCVYGLAPLLSDILNRHLSLLQYSEMGDEEVPQDLEDVFAEFRSDVESIGQRARMLTGPDPKLEAFLKVIRDKQKLPNNKLLVFSTFRHTLSYLEEKLKDESTRKLVRIGLIHGDIPDDERRDLRNRFSLPKDSPQAIDVLLSSEVGCEGLDYQFCDGLVNYDLPWNPMRIEQRIGRIDRYGQKSETVAIYNFITPGTVDAEIYERCLLRIGVFRQALGGSEEILGRITREIHEIAENLELTPEEQADRLQQLADNEIRIIQEQANLEDEQSKLFGLAIPQDDKEMVKQASSFWLAPSMLANLTARYLETLGATNLPAVHVHKPVTTLQLGQDTREKLLKDFHGLGQNGPIARAWELWLKGNDPYLALTFDPVSANEHRDLVFITPTHPLARQAARILEPTMTLSCNLAIKASGLPPGRYPYAIYGWRSIGLREDFTFHPVCSQSELASKMLELLESATPHELPAEDITAEEEHDLERIHYHHWVDVRASHIEKVEQTSGVRLASLNTTHKARVSLLGEQRDTASDARIRRMKDSQIETARRDFTRRVESLQKAPSQADVMAEALVFGVLIVEGKK
jgi:ATP-dependent helicase HepA